MTHMLQPHPAQDFDVLDGFDLEDEFLDLQSTAVREAPVEPAVAAEEASTPRDAGAYDPVGRLLAETETAINGGPFPVASAAPVEAAPPVVATAMTPVEAAPSFSTLSLAGPASLEVSIPRIGVHVFAERQDTAAAAERAGQDRRMARATTQIRLGGVQAAIELYQSEPTPPLIIVESLKDPQTLLWEIDQLAEVCDAGTKVVIIGATNDILLFRELMRRGVSE